MGDRTQEGSSRWGARGDLLLLSERQQEQTPDALCGRLLRNLITLQGAGRLEHSQPTEIADDTFAVRIELGDTVVAIQHVGGEPGNVNIGEFILEIDAPGSARAFIVASFLPPEQRVALRHLWSAIWETAIHHLRNAVHYSTMLLDLYDEELSANSSAASEGKEAGPEKTL